MRKLKHSKTLHIHFLSWTFSMQAIQLQPRVRLRSANCAVAFCEQRLIINKSYLIFGVHCKVRMRQQCCFFCRNPQILLWLLLTFGETFRIFCLVFHFHHLYKDEADGSWCFKASLVEESGVMPTEGWWALRQLAVGGHFSIRGCREPGKGGRSQTGKFYVSAFKRKLSDKSDKKMTCCKK